MTTATISPTRRPATPAYGIHEPTVRRALELILAPGQVTELRALNARIGSEWRAGTYSGYYCRETIDDLIRDLSHIQSASAVYFLPNPVKPALHARRYNRAEIINDRTPITGDKDILSRRWLLIDIDAIRPAGISATDDEKAAAYELVIAVDYALWERGYPGGIIGDSGNGYHLMLPCDLPATSDYPAAMLKSLAAEFDCAAATIDTSVGNAARIWKLPGTMSCKGDHAPEIGREWRLSRIISDCREDI